MINTAAMRVNCVGDESQYRTLGLIRDAVSELLSRDPAECTGRQLTDEKILRDAGFSDADRSVPRAGDSGAAELRPPGPYVLRGTRRCGALLHRLRPRGGLTSSAACWSGDASNRLKSGGMIPAGTRIRLLR
jgi:hypothetical protein